MENEKNIDEKQNKVKKYTKKDFLKEAIYLVIMCFGIAVSYYTFVTPNHFAPGGVYGVGSMIQNKTQGLFGLENGIPWAIPVILCSIPLVIASALVLDRRSAVVVVSCVLVTNLFDVMLELIHFPQFVGTTELQKCFSAAAGGMLSGVMFALQIKHFGTADGTVAIAAIVKAKKPQSNIAWLTFAFDIVVVAASFFIYWSDYTKGVSGGINAKLVSAFQPIIYSVVNMFFISKFCDMILKGFDTAYKFEVITDEPEKLSGVLIEKLGHGVTAIPAKGMYSGEEKTIVMCIVPKRQIGDFKRILKSFPNSFAYITSANEIIGMYRR